MFLISAIAAYLVIFIISGLAFVRWLHDVRRSEFGDGWFLPILLGFTVALFWPVSLVLFYFNIKDEKDK